MNTYRGEGGGAGPYRFPALTGEGEHASRVHLHLSVTGQKECRVVPGEAGRQWA
ncbi:hypothetical protein [Deinococcus wulumuqiensis]|uniref:hypothetical protein n=1 Tax=Deinococcus wulumuqiensis TaxID=980427 RepID=UPI001375D8E0|nr:hypothetical protein [Deinococcus wulumuqiensis]QII22283.1 hypothetical protein G6R31_15580 [Deinococcus wulumuqiensis R12]